MGYTSDMIKGVSWVGAFRLATRIISILRTIILARILLPSQFGAFGIASVVVAFLEVLIETGVNVILIQEREKIDRYISSAWIVSIIRGFIIGIIILLSAYYISQFFHSEESLFLLQLISIVPIVRGFINPSVVKFQKNLQFNNEFWFRLSVLLVDAFIVIIFAFITKSASSFAYGLIAGVLLEVILSWIIVKPRPSFSLEKEFIIKIFHKGKWVTASGIFTYLFHNIGNIAVGKIMNTSFLGFYQLAYSISILPVTEIADVVTRVTFPIFSKISNDKERLKNAFFRTLIIVSIVSTIFGVFLYIFSERIVLIILGSKWLPIIPVLKILAIFGIIKAISNSTSSFFLSLNQQKYVSIINLIGVVVIVVTIIPLVINFGIVGASYASLISSIVPFPLMCYYSLKVLKEK